MGGPAGGKVFYCGLLRLATILPGTSDDAYSLFAGHPSNLNPILFSHIFIDLDGSRIKTVTAILLATRDPILLASFTVEVIGLKAAAGDVPEPAPSVIYRLARL